MQDINTGDLLEEMKMTTQHTDTELLDRGMAALPEHDVTAVFEARGRLTDALIARGVAHQSEMSRHSERMITLHLTVEDATALALHLED